MRFDEGLVNTTAAVATDVFQLRAGAIDDRRNLFDLVGRQVQFTPEPLAHAVSDDAVVRRCEKKMSRLRCDKEGAGNAAGNKHKQEPGDQFPFQLTVHREASSWMAYSARANSFVRGSLNRSRLLRIA